MNILIVAKLANETLENLIIKPLLEIPFIEAIYILRDTKGYEHHDKIKYLTVEKDIITKKHRHLKKIRDGIKYSKLYNIDVIIGILIYPHGFIGQAISALTRKPYIHITIAGHREFWIYGKIMEKFTTLVFKRSLFVLVTGTNTYDFLKKKGYSATKLQIFPNIIDMKEFKELNLKREIDVISLSRIDKNKNVSLLLRAVSNIINRIKLSIFIVGVGPELPKLKEEAKELGVSEYIYFAGWLEENQKAEIYNKSKIFVSCSKGEGFPLTLLESMSCGCVPVATDVGDVSDVIVHGKNGFLITDFENENELAEYLLELLTNNDLLENMHKESLNIRRTHRVENNKKLWSDMLVSISNK